MVDQVCAIMFKYRQKNIRGGEQADLSRPKPAAAGRKPGKTNPRTPGGKVCRQAGPVAARCQCPGRKPTGTPTPNRDPGPPNRRPPDLQSGHRTLSIPRPNHLTSYLSIIYPIISHLNLIYLILSYYFISLPPIIEN